MPKFFISYRRKDTAWVVAYLSEGLRTTFGQESVFLDIDSIPLGLDFRAAIDEAVGACDVVLAIIGPDWFGWDAERKNKRIDKPTDYLRLEVEAALRRNIPVVPVLVDNTPMPDEGELADCLKPIVYRHASQFRSGLDAGRDRSTLLQQLQELVARCTNRTVLPDSKPEQGATAGKDELKSKREQDEKEAVVAKEIPQLDNSKSAKYADPIEKVDEPREPFPTAVPMEFAYQLPPTFDVFISAKSQDYEHAHRVYQFLVDQGLSVFFSHVTLPGTGRSDYRRQIDRSIEVSRHFVLVSSSQSNIESGWVQAELDLFINEKRAGRKDGGIFTLMLDGLSIEQLPITLRSHEAWRFGADSLERLVSYLIPVAKQIPTPSKKFNAEDFQTPSVEASIPKPKQRQRESTPEVKAVEKPKVEKRKARYDHSAVLASIGELSLLVSESAELQTHPDVKNQLLAYLQLIFDVKQRINARKNRYDSFSESEDAMVDKILVQTKSVVQWFRAFRTPDGTRLAFYWRPDSLSRWKRNSGRKEPLRDSINQLLKELE